MAVKGALTTSVAVSSTRPSTYDVAGYGAIASGDWEECEEATNVGEFGREYNTVTATNLAEGATRKFKGSYNNGQFTMDLLFDSADDGQTEIEGAETSIDPYSFRIDYPGGSGAERFYFEALVMSVKRVVGGPDDALMLRCSVELTHEPIVETTQ